MSYVRTVPKNRVDALAYLGTTNWLTPLGTSYEFSRDELRKILDASRRFGQEVAVQVREIINLSVSPELRRVQGYLSNLEYAHLFFMASKVLGSGQKTIRLTAEWCEAFENTDLTLCFQDYKQPFETMVIELPLNYVEAKHVPQLNDYPELMAFHLNEANRVLVVEIVLHKSQSHLSIPFQPDQNIEDVLSKLAVIETTEAGYSNAPGIDKYMANFIRIGLNAIVAMVYGTDWAKLAPTDGNKHSAAQLKTKIRSQDREAAARAKLRLGIQPDIFEFNQTIKAFETEPEEAPRTPADGNGSPKKPHWRRGHLRLQAMGTGWSQRTVRWIRPMLINAKRFKGNLKDTTTTYEPDDQE